MCLWCRDEALYSTTNGSSRYTFDPDYGGKVSMPTAHQPGPSRPDTLMSRIAPDASRPRALFADDRSRYAGSMPSCGWAHRTVDINVQNQVDAAKTG